MRTFTERRPEATNPAERVSVSGQLASMRHGSEAGIKWLALSLAVAVHVVFLLLNFPEMRQAVRPTPRGPVLIVRKYIPPPPEIPQPRRTVQQRKELTRRIPIPDPTPDEPEPIREPEPEVVVPPIPDDVEVLIGVPDPPAPVATRPMLAGVGGVTMPQLIPETKVPPLYPELARVARIEGRVVLQAVICTDGSVTDLEVLRCSHPKLGFEEAAVDAVRQWRYKPALLDGRPVEVYFTVLVDFELL
jgi:protein TonB